MTCNNCKPITGFASRRDAIRAYADGTRTAREISGLTGIPTQRVRTEANHMGLSVRLEAPPDPWPPERVELLKKLWADGLTALQVAARLGDGITRNAVIGKVHRLGLELRGGGWGGRPRKPREPHTKPPRLATLSETRKESYLVGDRLNPREHANAAMLARRIEANRRLAEMAPGNRQLQQFLDAQPRFEPEPQPIRLVDIPRTERITILMLTDKTCRWPLGEPRTENFCFCGQPPKAGKPYCEFHCGLAYVPHERRGAG